MKSMALILGVLFLITGSITLAKDIYNYTNEAGNTSYSNVPSSNMPNNDPKDSQQKDEYEIILTPRKRSDAQKDIVISTLEDQIDKLKIRQRDIDTEILNLQEVINSGEKEMRRNLPKYANCFVILEDTSQTSYIQQYFDPYYNYNAYLMNTYPNVSPSERAYCRILVEDYYKRRAEIDSFYHSRRSLQQESDALYQKQLMLQEQFEDLR